MTNAGALARQAVRRRRRACAAEHAEGHMAGLLLLGVMLMFGVLLLGLIGGIIKVVFWLLFLPLRLAFRLVTLPLMAIGLVFKLAVGAMLLPVLLVVGVVGIVGLGLAAIVGLLLPLIPLVLVGLLIWGFVRLVSRPAAVPPSA
jgi:hypothetical protein